MTIAVGIPGWVAAYCDQQQDEHSVREFVIHHTSPVDQSMASPPMQYSEEDIEQALHKHQQLRMEQGIVKADTMLIKRYIAKWLDCLEHGITAPQYETWMHTCVAMHVHRPARDACILSVLDETLDIADMELLSIGVPRTPCARKTAEIIERAYKDKSLRPNLVRCQHGIDYLVEVVRCVPYEYSEQAFAALTYILWFVGQQTQSYACAQQTLAINATNTLAKIIEQAIIRGLFPRWVGQTQQLCRL